MKNKDLGRVSSLFLCCKTLEKMLFLVIYHLGNFHNLIQSVFWIIRKIVFANLCKPVDNFIIITVSFDPLNIETVERKGKNLQKNEYLKNKKSFLGEINKILKCLILVNFKKEKTSFKIQYARGRKALILRILKVRRNKLNFELDAVV